MPRIDPLQLLNCLQILLNKDGGILSKDEVQRLVNLMTKFSKKLVSKVIYTLILKNTEPALIAQFMADGGWRLIHLWLQEAMAGNNMSLTKEILELLLIVPIDVCLLRSNFGIPKLVKNLTKRDDPEVQNLSKTLVENWLRIVKGNNAAEQQSLQTQEMPQTKQEISAVPQGKPLATTPVENSGVAAKRELEENGGSVYKLSVRDGKQVISRFPQTTDEVSGEETVNDNKTVVGEKEVMKESEEKKKEKASHDRSKHKSSKSSGSSSNSSSSKSSSKDKHRDKERSSSSSSSSSKDKKSSSNSSSNKDKDRKDRKDRDKDKHRSNGSLKSSSSSSNSKSKDKEKDKKESKEKQAEKDKDTLSKVLPQTQQKLARIPKRPSEEKNKETTKEIKKEKNFSIEPRKPGEERPRTVKVFNAKMRSTGLEEEVKPPPPRTVKKPTPSVTLPSIPQKRPSPVKDLVIPEKKPKIDISDRPGAIKLIPPKPKPAILQESDIFMDALAASATTKKEPKKRKRRASVSKDSASSSPPQSPLVTNSPNSLKNITPPKFYQDTLEDKTEDTKDDNAEDNQGGNTPTDNGEPMEESNNINNSVRNKLNSAGLKSVLVHGKRSGPKKSIKWKPDDNLVEVQYFELDETERVNVTKNFMDMAKMEMTSEREALQMSRKLQNEDLMDTQTVWRKPIEMDLPPPMAVPGCQSLEKDIQFAREKVILQALYFNKRMMPDSPAEPDPENHQMIDPILIPLEDPINNQEQDLRNVPWPEPKGSPPPEPQPINIPPLFQNPPTQFPNFPNIGPPANFQGLPPQFPAPGNPPNFMPPNLIPNEGWGNPQMMPPDIMNQPNIFGPGGPNGPPPDNFNPMMNENFNPMQFNQPNMFPPNNFNMPRGGRGGFRGRGGPWVRMNGPAPGGWHRGGGAPHRGGRFCKNVKIHGYCRNRDNCPFVHPN